MSLDAIRQISAAEEEAEKKRSDALLEAKKILASAEEAGKETLKKAAAEAEEKIAEIFKASDANAQAEARKISDEALLQCEVLEKNASAQMEKAVSIIVERIVNG